jgi:hypothetical protein
MIIENGGDHKECGVHAFSSLIHLFREWRSLDYLCLALKRLVCWSKFLEFFFFFFLLILSSITYLVLNL